MVATARGLRWLALAVSGGGLAAGASAGDAAAEACRPAAVVVGDDGLVRDIEAVLRGRGVVVVGDDGAAGDATACAVHAEIFPEEDHRVRVTITDGEGRTVERLTSDAGTAATAIESWARRDVIDPLLVGHAPPPRHGGAVDAAALAPGPRARRFELGANLDGGVSGDGAVWSGLGARGCVMVGDVCVGALVRYGVDTETAGDTVLLENGRSALDLTVVVELPLERERWTVSPVAGLGQTSLTAVRDLPGQEESEQASSWHLLAGMAGAMRLGGAWSARLDVGVAVSPFAHTRLGENDGVDRQLAALPRTRGWLGLGVTYEAR